MSHIDVRCTALPVRADCALASGSAVRLTMVLKRGAFYLGLSQRIGKYARPTTKRSNRPSEPSTHLLGTVWRATDLQLSMASCGAGGDRSESDVRRFATHCRHGLLMLMPPKSITTLTVHSDFTPCSTLLITLVLGGFFNSREITTPFYTLYGPCVQSKLHISDIKGNIRGLRV